MLTIAAATREIVSRRPFLEDALAQGIINYNSLADQILPEIRLLTNKHDAKMTTISMALRRLGETYKANILDKLDKKLKDYISSETSLKYDLCEVTYHLSIAMDLSRYISQLYGELTVDPNDFLSVTKGKSELTIITNTRNKPKLMSVFKNHRPKNETNNLAALTITIPEDSLEIPGLFYYFTKALTLEGINIVELISTFSEMQFILDEEMIAEAAKIIRSLLKSTEPIR